MGCNYYAVKKKPSIKKEPLHIGKSSAGWKFLFQGYQDKEMNWNEPPLNINSIEDWKEYLKNDELVILDEEDNELSYDDFFKLVEKKQKENNPDDFTYSANINGYRFSYNDFS